MDYGVNLTRFKKDISKGLSINDEDQWTFDYESYLSHISIGRFESPEEWAVDYYKLNP